MVLFNKSQRMPVLVGIAAIQQKDDDVARMDEALLLMQQAVEKAVLDAGAPALLRQIDYIGVPQGFWSYSDPARLIARAVGSPEASTCLAGIGISQQSLISDACSRIAEGDIDVAVVTGGEAKYRSLQAQIQGLTLTDTVQERERPDRHWQREDDLWSQLEEQRGLLMPVEFYALIESALCTAKGHNMAQHRRYLGELYAGFSDIAAKQHDAWYKQPLTAEEISEPADGNPFLAFPYTKKHNSQWNVNQAGALLFCSAGKADELGIPEEKRIYPWVASESNHMVALSERPQIHRHNGMAECAKAVFAKSGLSPADVDRVDLYSCFPAAVQSHALDIGLPDEMAWTQTGGMAFHGGPLNNYVIQSTVVMAEQLRKNRQQKGLISCISGINNKQGLALYSAVKPAENFENIDVTRAVAKTMVAKESIADYQGMARLLAATVVFKKGIASHAFAIAETDQGQRLVCRSSDESLLEQLQQQDHNGRLIDVQADGDFCLREE